MEHLTFEIEGKGHVKILTPICKKCKIFGHVVNICPTIEICTSKSRFHNDEFAEETIESQTKLVIPMRSQQKR